MSINFMSNSITGSAFRIFFKSLEDPKDVIAFSQVNQWAYAFFSNGKYFQSRCLGLCRKKFPLMMENLSKERLLHMLFPTFKASFPDTCWKRLCLSLLEIPLPNSFVADSITYIREFIRKEHSNLEETK